MDNTKLIDSIEMLLELCEDVLTAVNKNLSGGLKLYLDHFIAPFVGDWPMQLMHASINFMLLTLSLCHLKHSTMVQRESIP